MSAPAGPRRNAAAARSARLACVATAAACGACTGRSARPPGSIRCTAARRAAAAGGGASAGAASQPSAAAAASSSQAASPSSASALRSGSGNPGVATRVSPLSSASLVCYQAGVVGPVYTAHVTVRHDELDRFGRLHPAVYLRYLAHAAVEASTAAGYDAAWYARAGTMWLVRRSTLDVRRPVRAGERLLVSTWVEDFRRVRSHRRYELVGTDGLCVDARTDWVYVDAESLRPRRVPAELAG